MRTIVVAMFILAFLVTIEAYQSIQVNDSLQNQIKKKPRE